MIFEFLKAAMPTPLRNPDKYEIFSSYADIYRLLELSGDADNLTRTFFCTAWALPKSLQV